MAITNSDGSIILSTKVDTSGINKGMSQMQGKATSLTKTFSKLGAAIASAFAIQKIIQFSNESASLATQTEASVQRLVDIYGSASDAVGDFIDQNARALGMSKSAAASFSSVYGNLFSAFADQATNAELTNEYLQMTAVVASKTGRTVEDVQERIRSGLLGNTEAIEDLGIFVNVKTIEMTDAFQRMANGKSWEQLDAYTQQQIRAMAILEQSTAKYGDEVSDTSATIRNQFNAAYQDFQNSWGTIVNQVLLPALQVLTEIFNIATAGLNALSGIDGKILEDADAITDNSADTAKNIEEQVDAQKALNKELKKSLAGFDDIQILSSQTEENKGGGLDSGLQGIGSDLGGDLNGSAYVDEVDKTLTAIMGIVALSLAAVGLILLFTGHIGYGIGFIIAGAAALTVTMATASEFKYDGIIQMLTTIMGVAGGVLLALGIILLWIGGVVGTPIAIGMIIAGGAMIVSAVAAQVAFAPGDIAAWLSLIMGIAGGALLALGIILCMVGSVPLGIGMIIAGAASIVSAVALNFDFIVEAIKGPIGAIMALVGGVLLVIGIILVCTGAALPLAIGLISVGAVGLAAEAALNWNAITEKLQGTIGIITTLVSGSVLVLGVLLVFAGIFPLGLGLIVVGAAGLATAVAANWTAITDMLGGTVGAIVAIASGAILALGIILTCVGIFPLGIGLIALGAAGLATEAALNWNSIVDNIKNFLFENAELISMISGGLLVLGIVLCVAGLLPIGIALIAAGVVGLASEVVLNWNAIVTNIKTFLFENSTLLSLISGGLLILGIVLCVVGIFPLGIGLIAAGAVGLASTVALNWNGIVTKIKEALFENTVLKALISGGLLILGIILCATGVALPLGIGLIVAGAAGLAKTFNLGNAIVDMIKGVWDSIKSFWKNHIAVIFTAKWWLDLAKKCINGLLSGFTNGINGIIWLFENMINIVVKGLNLISFEFPDWVPGMGGKRFGINIPLVNFKRLNIPQLAKGAVIPPNKEFLAVLGDQKQGTNIEAPLQTIVDAFNIALSQNGSYRNDKNVEVTLEVDGREFGRAVVELGGAEDRRIGTRLVIA